MAGLSPQSAILGPQHCPLFLVDWTFDNNSSWASHGKQKVHSLRPMPSFLPLLWEHSCPMPTALALGWPVVAVILPGRINVLGRITQPNKHDLRNKVGKHDPLQELEMV